MLPETGFGTENGNACGPGHTITIKQLILVVACNDLVVGLIVISSHQRANETYPYRITHKVHVSLGNSQGGYYG